MKGADEARVLTRAAKGDTEAFQELFEAHHAAIFRFAYRLASAGDVAEDLTQECFVRVIRQPAFDPERGSLRQYFYGVVRNLVRQHQHATSREVAWDGHSENPDPSIAAGPDSLASADLSAAVQAALSALPPLQREALVLCEFEELSLGEAAAALGADIGTVKSRLHRARERLRRSLAPHRSCARTSLPKESSL